MFVANVFGREIADRRERLSEEERRELESWETFEALTTLTRIFNRDAARLSRARSPRPGERKPRGSVCVFLAVTG